MNGLIAFSTQNPHLITNKELHNLLVRGPMRLLEHGRDTTGIAYLEPDQEKASTIKELVNPWEFEKHIFDRFRKNHHFPHCMRAIVHNQNASSFKKKTIQPVASSCSKIYFALQGQVENFIEINNTLENAFNTPIELIVHLAEKEISEGKSLVKSVQSASKKLEGKYTIVCFKENSQNEMYAVSRGNKVFFCHSRLGNFVSSAKSPLIDFSHNIFELADRHNYVINMSGHFQKENIQRW